MFACVHGEIAGIFITKVISVVCDNKNKVISNLVYALRILTQGGHPPAFCSILRGKENRYSQSRV